MGVGGREGLGLLMRSRGPPASWLGGGGGRSIGVVLGSVEPVIGELEQFGDAAYLVGAAGDAERCADRERFAEHADAGASGRDRAGELAAGRLGGGQRRVGENDGELV